MTADRAEWKVELTMTYKQMGEVLNDMSNEEVQGGMATLAYRT